MSAPIRAKNGVKNHGCRAISANTPMIPKPRVRSKVRSNTVAITAAKTMEAKSISSVLGSA